MLIQRSFEDDHNIIRRQAISGYNASNVVVLI